MTVETKALDIDLIQAEFPILSVETRPGVPLIYLDSAATSQKPRRVIQAMTDFYERYNANVHRGIYRLAEEATEAYEGARQRIADFVGAPSARQVIFTRNATEAINLVAFSWGRSHLQPGQMVVLTEMEHHSNLIPWQMLAAERGLRLEFVPPTDDGQLDLEVYRSLLQQGPQLVSFTHVSNVLGTINPVAEMAAMAHQAGAIVLVDGAQSVPHLPVNFAELGVDFLVFSSHKMCGPTGIGVLVGREDLLEAMPPFMGGGEMIKRVHLREFTPDDLPAKFEAGTPAIAEAIGLGAAVDFLGEIGMAAVRRHEEELVSYALDRLAEVPGLRLLGPSADRRCGVAAFWLEAAHPHDIAQLLDREGIAVRAGHHCAQPIHDRLGLPASTRASFYLYNTRQDIDRLAQALYHVIEFFA
jgi:cysteine desulfurase/selenocysteine lyase